jgi:acyl dehydratase
MRRDSTVERGEAAAEWRRRTEEAFAALPVGSEFVYTRTFSLADVAAFVGVTGDFNHTAVPKE